MFLINKIPYLQQSKHLTLSPHVRNPFETNFGGWCLPLDPLWVVHSCDAWLSFLRPTFCKALEIEWSRPAFLSKPHKYVGESHRCEWSENMCILNVPTKDKPYIYKVWSIKPTRGMSVHWLIRSANEIIFKSLQFSWNKNSNDWLDCRQTRHESSKRDSWYVMASLHGWGLREA